MRAGRVRVLVPVAAAAVLFLRSAACLVITLGYVRRRPDGAGLGHRNLVCRVGEKVESEGGKDSSSRLLHKTVTTFARCDTRYGQMAYRVVRHAEQPNAIRATTAHDMAQKLGNLMAKQHDKASPDSMMHVVFIHGLGNAFLILWYNFVRDECGLADQSVN